MKRIFRCVQRQDYEKVLAYAIFIDFAFQLGIGGGYAILSVGSFGLIGFYVESIPMGMSRLLFLLFHVIIAIFFCLKWRKFTKDYTYFKKIKIIGTCYYCKRETLSTINTCITKERTKNAEIVCSFCNRVLAKQSWFIGGGSDG